MKIRNGFVSNSSSASFIVTWKINDKDIIDSVRTPYTNRSILITIMKMFDLWDIEMVPQDLSLDYESFKLAFDKEKLTFFGKEVYNLHVYQYAWLVAKETKLIDYTQTTKTFNTEFITSMLNDAESFGEAPMYMLMNFYTKYNDSYELIKAKIERD